LDEHRRVDETYPIEPFGLSSYNESEVICEFTTRARYRVVKTDAARLATAIDEALAQVTIVPAGIATWVIRNPVAFPAALQREAFVNAEDENGRTYFYLVTRIPIPDGKPSATPGPWESLDDAFAHFQEWRRTLYDN
jgi:hypothetical protein